MKLATLAEIYAFFSDRKTNGYTYAAFKADWSALSDQDKLDFKTGIGDGTLTY